MNKVIKLLPLIVILTSCGLFEDDDETGSSETQTEINNLGMIELGPVRGATVSLQSLNGITLTTSITDDNGLFPVDIEVLKSAVERYGSELKFVKIVSTGGIDIDPNDDGVTDNGEELSVNGQVTGIVPLETLYEAKEYRINFISSALVDILDGRQEITEAQLAYIVQRLGVHDINEDGLIDIDDLTSYKIIDDNSVAETNLREGYLEYIHNGNNESQHLFVENLKYDIGFSKPLVTKKLDYYAVNLSKTNKDNTIYYGIAVDENYPGFNEYTGEELDLNFNEAIFYQECSPESGCYKLQKIFFYADTVYYDFDYENIEDKTNDVMNIVSDLDTAREDDRILNQQIETTEQTINSLNEKIDKLNVIINSI